MLKIEFWKNKKIMKITASLFLLAVFLLLSLLGSGSGIQYETETGEGQILTENDEISNIEGEITADSQIIFVDVVGCVLNPGVYQLNAGSRVFQLIDLAGGLTPDADLRSINRAAILSDEQVVRVLSVDEYEELQNSSGGVGFVDGKVELNSADAKALESLSGIGPSMAQKIIDYRMEHGKFKIVEDLKKVSGIGEKTFQRIKDQICVQ
ncbi:MAG: ComEA family DNA-binding protein [Firmicutes bacterium]|nr:ComEA family DNA-binding protein [Bacillota bacterium]